MAHPDTVHHFFMDSLQGKELPGVIVPQPNASLGLKLTSTDLVYLSEHSKIEFFAKFAGPNDVVCGVSLEPGAERSVDGKADAMDFGGSPQTWLVLRVSIPLI